jgi:mRNA interferase MazF
MRNGDICLIDLSVGVGHEQYGKRPAILISESTNVAIVIPLTTNLNSLRFPYTIEISPDNKNNLEHPSVALIFHLKSIDKSRLIPNIGKINKTTLDNINNVLRRLLKL